MEEKEIRCFQHCSTDKNIFCFDLPNTCPLCFQQLISCVFQVPPFCLPSPFHYHISTLITMTSASRQPIQPFSVVVRPTNGTFLSSYRTGDDLHIGVTNSYGHVFSFDERGVISEMNHWDCSLCIPMMDEDDNDDGLSQEWDKQLIQSQTDPTWHCSRYYENTYNCYSFVIAFLTNVLKIPISKKAFCENQLVRETARAAKYISLFRQISSNTVVLQDSG